MRSLFIKIFLCFWLAHMVGLAAFMFWTFGMSFVPGHRQVRAMGGKMIAVIGQDALTALERAGPAELRRHVEQVDRATGVHVFLLDDRGQDTAGRRVPAGAAELADYARRSGQTELKYLPENVELLARRVSGSGGKTYVVVAQSFGRRIPPILTDPLGFVCRLAVFLAAAGVVCYFLARYLTRPLRKLQTSARQLAGGDLAARAAVGKRRDEIGELGRDFDFMAERLESLVSVQRRLLRDISHELRSPLARLNIALGLARRQIGSQDCPPLDRIARETERLKELIGRLLELARLEGTDSLTPRVMVDLGAIVREIAADADFEAKGGGLSVRLLRCDECTLQGMPELLRSAIENVVRNGIRHTAPGTEVEILLACQANQAARQAVICVRDHGPGVPEDCVQNIFLPFYRIEDDRNRQSGGVGLGLAIALQAVRIHGGTITASNASGGGLCVEIQLPVTQGLSSPAAANVISSVRLSS